VFIRENWIFARSTRYCRQCLAGDGSPIQRRHGGAWSKLWRLPVVFACPTHRRLLGHLCPAYAPVHQRRAGGPQLLPLAAHPVVHPAACRNPTTPKAPYQPCGHRLDQAPDGEAEPRSVGDEPLCLQQRLLTLLSPEALGEVISVRQPTAPARYFVDLRIMTALLQVSWPATQDLVTPAEADHIGNHVQRTREQIAATEAAGRTVHHMRVYDKPPLDTTTAVARSARPTASWPAVRRAPVARCETFSTPHRSPVTGPAGSSSATAAAHLACMPPPEPRRRPNT
jgi:hypothetical protein